MMKRKGLGKRIMALLAAASIAFGGMTAIARVEAKAHPFQDVTSENWFNDDVERAFQTGLVNGKDAVTFDPFGNLSAAEAVKLAVAMNQKTLEGAVTIQNGDPWYTTWVAAAKERGIISRDYNWNNPVTRAEYMAIFAKALPDSHLQAINTVPDGSVPDVSASHQDAAAIYKLYRAGIVEGNDAVTRVCLPNNMITRGEVSAITTRMMDSSQRKSFVMSGGSSEGINTEIPVTPSTPSTPVTPSIPETPSDPETPPSPETPSTPEIKDPEPTPVPLKAEISSDVGTIPINGTAKLTVKATGGKLPYTYQWYKLHPGSGMSPSPVMKALSGATNAELTVKYNEKDSLMVFNCRVTDAEGTEVSGNEISLQQEYDNTGGMIITSQPQSSKFTKGGTKDLQVVVKGGTGALTYKWEKKTSGSWQPQTNEYEDLQKAPAYKGKFKASEAGTYRCVITDAEGHRITSNECMLTEDTSVKPLTIKKDLVDTSFSKGGQATLVFEFSGGVAPYKVTWFHHGWEKETTKMETKVTKTINVDKSAVGSYYVKIVDANGTELRSASAQVK